MSASFLDGLASGRPAPRRIFFLDSSPFCGGAQESLLSLASSLSADGLSVQLATADCGANGLLFRAASLGVPVFAFAARHWPASPAGLLQAVGDCRRAAPQLREQLRQFQPDIIHLNGLRAALVYAFLGDGVIKDYPVVLHDRDLRVPRGLRFLLARWLSPHVIAISSVVADCWRQLLPKDQLHLAPNGLPIEEIQATSPAPAHFADGHVESGATVVLAADFVTWKRQALFMEALALARREYPWRAVLRGRTRGKAGEKLLQQLRTQAKNLGLTSAELVFVTEPGPALPWLAGADLVCACSEQEPFGRVLVEALALGKPLAVTTTAGAPEIINDCPAITIADDTPQDLANAINAWQEAGARQSAAANARQRAAEFDLRLHVTAIKSAYGLMLAEN